MATILQNGSVQFGDGTVQTTATPTNVSAFANDRGYTTLSAMQPTYTARSTAVNRFSAPQNAMYVGLTWYDVNGTLMGSADFNCNCNC